jgi:hypothetical protein
VTGPARWNFQHVASFRLRAIKGHRQRQHLTSATEIVTLEQPCRVCGTRSAAPSEISVSRREEPPSLLEWRNPCASEGHMPPFSSSKRRPALAALPKINVGGRVFVSACNDNHVLSPSTTDLWEGLVAQELIFACECLRPEEQIVRRADLACSSGVTCPKDETTSAPGKGRS